MDETKWMVLKIKHGADDVVEEGFEVLMETCD